MVDFSDGVVLDAGLFLFSGVDVVVVLKKRRISPNLLSAFRLLLSQLVCGSRAVGFGRVSCLTAAIEGG